MNIFPLLQPHTIDLYDLRNKQYEIKHVPASSLLNVKRFDLFAKLYYIRLYSTDKEKALKIYTEHIKAFNPDLREPGRGDKTSLTTFIDTFDRLIEAFRENDFDEKISIVPIDGDNVILDGAHRVAALAYYNKEVTVAQFQETKAKMFDCTYFKMRGLRWKTCDIISSEMTYWMGNIENIENEVTATTNEDGICEFLFRLKHIYWLNCKVFLVQLIHYTGTKE